MKIVINKEELESHVVDFITVKYQQQIIVGPLFGWSHRSRADAFVSGEVCLHYRKINGHNRSPVESIPGSKCYLNHPLI